jgi:3-oxoacyl-[acyl-carrier-protein] synthase-3
MNNKISIAAVGHYLPNKVMSNKLISKHYNITESEIFRKTGIKERRYVENLNTTDIVCNAIENLLTKTSKKIEDIDCIIVGTLTPDHFFPSTAVGAINKLGAVNAWGFDLSAACSGFCYGLSVGEDMIKSGSVKNVIVCGADVMSNTLNSFDYKTAVLFGDGAGAVLLENIKDSTNSINGKLCKVKADNLEVEDVYFKTPFFSENWSLEKFELKGGKVYRSGVSIMIDSIKEYLSNNKLKLEDFDYIIPHQANLNMLKDVAKGLKVDLDFFKINIEKRGNTGGASIPICLSEFVENGELKKGHRVLLVSFGAGYTISVIDLNLA